MSSSMCVCVCARPKCDAVRNLARTALVKVRHAKYFNPSDPTVQLRMILEDKYAKDCHIGLYKLLTSIPGEDELDVRLPQAVVIVVRVVLSEVHSKWIDCCSLSQLGKYVQSFNHTRILVLDSTRLRKLGNRSWLGNDGELFVEISFDADGAIQCSSFFWVARAKKTFITACIKEQRLFLEQKGVLWQPDLAFTDDHKGGTDVRALILCYL